MMGLHYKKYWKAEFGTENGIVSVRRVTGNVKEPTCGHSDLREVLLKFSNLTGVLISP
jgi:hypothetical protein